MNTTILNELLESQAILDEFIRSMDQQKNIEKAATLMIECLKNGGKIITCGNGGSMSDAMHFASELSGRYRKDRKPISAMAISDPSYLTCTANDMGYKYVFSRAFIAMARPGDILVCISTSGNSENVNVAAEFAKMKGFPVIGLTGRNGGLLKEYCDVEVRAPQSDYADRVQELHIKIIHILCKLIEEGLGYGE